MPMHKTIKYFIEFIKKIAFISANSLSMIGMYEPNCPENLKNNHYKQS